MKKLGFDFNWNSCFQPKVDLFPKFIEETIEVCSDGSKIMRDENGLIVQIKPVVISIPAEIDCSLKDRKSWEELYLPKMQFAKERIDIELLKTLKTIENREIPIGLHCGSLAGTMRNFLGVMHMSYLLADDEDLYIEIANTFADLSYNCVKTVLETGFKFDYAHYWEDICFKNGPLVSPVTFKEVFDPNYKRINTLLNEHGINIISVDCDGLIDSLVSTWLENGVNTMFPIEVGTWHASIEPWRTKYGKDLRGVGGMNKSAFAQDFNAIDKEIERLKPLVELGGYIPCPDHRIAPDAKFENVKYYCERLNETYNK